MKRFLRNLKWTVFGTPDLPPRDFEVTYLVNQYTGKEYLPKYMNMAELYLSGVDIEVIAKAYNCTRERVRQCVWKAYRRADDNQNS